MNRDGFESEVLNGARDEYVSEEALQYLRDSADFRVIDKSAMKKGDVEQTEFISIALPESGDSYSDRELIELVKEKLGDGQRDIQKYQMRDSSDAPNTVEIWRHGSGYSAFAFFE